MTRKTFSSLIITLSLFSLFMILGERYDLLAQLSAIYALKSQMGTITGQTDSALHAYFGFAIFGILTLVLRKPFHALTPCLVLWAVELFNEFIDIQNSLATLGSNFWANCLSDIFYTVAIPTAVFIIAKFKQYSDQTVASPFANDGEHRPLDVKQYS